MLYLQLLILAILQGATEFLPISSSGHLAVLPLVMAWEDQGLLIDVAVHVGTLLAVMIYFHRDIRGLLKGAFVSLGGKADYLDAEEGFYQQLFKSLVVASIPVLVAGAILAFAGYGEFFRRPDIIGAGSILFGLLLYWADQKGLRGRTLERMNVKRGLLVGLAQVLALIPGTSRAGITMTAGRALGFKRTEAARFSMLLSIPAIIAAGAWSMLELIRNGAPGKVQAALFAGGVAFVVAILAIHFLMKWLERASMTIFVIYRVAFGTAILIWLV